MGCSCSKIKANKQYTKCSNCEEPDDDGFHSPDISNRAPCYYCHGSGKIYF